MTNSKLAGVASCGVPHGEAARGRHSMSYPTLVLVCACAALLSPRSAAGVAQPVPVSEKSCEQFNWETTALEVDDDGVSKAVCGGSKIGGRCRKNDVGAAVLCTPFTRLGLRV